MPDAKPDTVPEDLTINDQESFIELVLEKVCGLDNIIEEHDEADDDSNDFEINKVIKLYTNTFPTLAFNQYFIETSTSAPRQEDKLSQYIHDIVPPPPKA